MGAPAILTITKAGEPVQSVPIDQEGSIIIGRGEDCVIRLDDRAISRKHAIFKKNGDVFQVEKKSEFAPLSVNGEEKTMAVIKAGDVIAIGPYLMKLSIPVEERREPVVEAPAPELVQAAHEFEAPAPAPTAVNAMEGSPLPQDEGIPNLEVAPVVEPPASDATAAVSLSDSSVALVPETGTHSTESIIIGAGGAGGADANPDLTSPIQEQSGPASEPITGIVVDPAAMADQSTKLVSLDQNLEASLVFQPGQANVTEYLISKEETSIGRGKTCDIILNDKRASRRNALILRNGLNFMIRDQGSANGVLVNGERVNEKDLLNDDRIVIGDTEFTFRAVKPDYTSVERKLTPLSSLSSSSLPQLPQLEEEQEVLAPYNPEGTPATDGAIDSPLAMDSIGIPDANAAAAASLNNIAGIAGVAGAASNKKLSLVDKYKALPPARRIMVILLAGAFVWLFMDDSDLKNARKPAPKPKVAQVTDAGSTTAKDAAAAFAALSPEQKKFVESQHELAFSFFQRKEYDRAIDEVSKIFTLVPDYKDSREIERYAREGKRRMDAALEERRKHDEEEALKRRIAGIVVEAGQKMDAKKYEAARALFMQILALDPENKQVAAWQRQLQEIEEQKKINAQKKIVQDEVNSQAWVLYRKGVELRKNGDPRGAVEQFLKTQKIDAADRRPANLSREQIAEIKDEIQKKVVPLLEDARKFEAAQDYVNAMHAFAGALKIDSSSQEASSGMDRLRGILHERGKVIFTEAIIAESYSDFPQAKKKFQECLQSTPDEDIYHARCERKLARYFDISGGGDQLPQ